LWWWLCRSPSRGDCVADGDDRWSFLLRDVDAAAAAVAVVTVAVAVAVVVAAAAAAAVEVDGGGGAVDGVEDGVGVGDGRPPFLAVGFGDDGDDACWPPPPSTYSLCRLRA